MAEIKMQEQVRENVMRLRNLEMNIAFAREQLQNLERALNEIGATRTAFSEIKNLKKDTPSIVPCGSGFYAAGILQKQEKVLADVGAGVIIEKTVEEAIKMIDDREGTVKRNIASFQQQLGSIEKEYGELSTETQKLMQKK